MEITKYTIDFVEKRNKFLKEEFKTLQKELEEFKALQEEQKNGKILYELELSEDPIGVSEIIVYGYNIIQIIPRYSPLTYEFESFFIDFDYDAVGRLGEYEDYLDEDGNFDEEYYDDQAVTNLYVFIDIFGTKDVIEFIKRWINQPCQDFVTPEMLKEAPPADW